jgi:hypothetical protein
MDQATVASKILQDDVIAELVSQLSPEKQAQLKDRVRAVLESAAEPTPAPAPDSAPTPATAPDAEPTPTPTL